MSAPIDESAFSRFSYPLSICSIPYILLSPFAQRAATTSAAPPRKSVALTFAECNLSTPLITAILSLISISVPNLLSSLTYLNRFSNIVSCKIDVPLASARATATGD